MSFITITLLSFLFLSPNAYSKAIDFYSKGALENPEKINENNDKIVKLFVKRKKLYTTKEMEGTLKKLADKIHTLFPDSEPLQIGDLSGIKGGKAPRHASHQNGLDADVVYLRNNRDIQDPTEPEWMEYFVRNDQISLNFDFNRNWEIFKYLTKNFPVGRIFVDQKIKEAYCKIAKKQVGSTEDKRVVNILRRLRPAKYHKTHFHLRLKCPKEYKECTPQADPARGSGCDEFSLNSIEKVETC